MVKQSTFFVISSQYIINANLIVVVRIERNVFILMALIAENSSDLS